MRKDWTRATLILLLLSGSAGAEINVNLAGINNVLGVSGLNSRILPARQAGVRQSSFAIERVAIVETRSPQNDMTELMNAVLDQDPARVRRHLDQISARGPGGVSATMLAANGDSTDILKTLLDRADIRTLRAKDDDGNNALSWAVLGNKPAAIGLLLQTGAFDESDRLDALALARRLGHSKAAEELG